MKGIEAHKYLLGDKRLLPCPFCGGAAYIDSCDRIIDIGCEPCGYRRAFHGIVQSEVETAVVASYDRRTKEPLEWYDMDAYGKAADAWNSRAKRGGDGNA